ncbi:MAG: sensor domain-containing diguanylate cyclase [Candidatus Omnitrophota bacterium]
MLSAVIFLAFIFVILLFYVVRKMTLESRDQQLDQLYAIRKNVEELMNQKNEVVKQKEVMTKKVEDIVTLYDMTREITKKSHEQEAFDVFRSTLKANVSFDDCRLIQAEGDRRKQNMDPKEYLIFPIKGHQSILGHIGIKGLSDHDKDKFIILAHQFALALQRVKLYQEVEQSAITDSLTGAHTRRYLMERLEEEIERSEMRKMSLSLLMIDVDHFKGVNDKHGHLVGDHVLRSINLMIEENIREIDYVGRYGGEEFCVVLPETDSEGGFFVAERIRKAIEETGVDAYDTKLKVTVSIGIASFPYDAKKSLELIDKADWALYRSKKRGRNCVTPFGSYDEKASQ